MDEAGDGGVDTGTLAGLLQDAVRKRVAGADTVGVMFSGGVDSTLLALLSETYSDAVTLYSVGFPESVDVESAGRVADELGLPWRVLELDDDLLNELLDTVTSVLPRFDVIDIELGIPLAACGRMMAEDGVETALSGQGAEELFAGYHRHAEHHEDGGDLNTLLQEEFEALPEEELPRNEAVMAFYGVETRYPFLDEDLARHALTLPPEQKLTADYKKYALRMAARELGVPEQAWKRPKKAMQYGSGIHSRIQDMARHIDPDEAKEEGYYGPIEKLLAQRWQQIHGTNPVHDRHLRKGKR